MDLMPNNSPFPSEAWNSPNLGPFLALAPGEILPIGRVPEETGIGNIVTGDIITPQGPVTSLMALRSQFPYLQVVPFSNEIETTYLVQNTPTEVRLPSGCVAVMFIGDGRYYVSVQGNAGIPGPTTGNTRSMFKPERHLFFVNGLHSLSLITPDATAAVTIMCFAPREMPTL